MAQNTGTLVTAAIRPNDSNDKIATFFANEGRGGHHAYATRVQRDSIIEERREWYMLCTVGDDKITYQLTKGYVNTNIQDNANWTVFRDEKPDAVGGLSPWSENAKPYVIATYVAHSDRIWESVMEGNNFEPGAIDPKTELPNSGWAERTKDALSHARNSDTQGLRSNGSVILFDNLAESVSLGEVSFVSLHGKDDRAARGRLDRPFKTIQAAINEGALTVVVLGGIFNEQVNIEYTHGCNRLLLWFGAVITSNGSYTLGVGKAFFSIEGTNLVSTKINTGWFQNTNAAIINTSSTGVTIQRLGNPGAVPLNLKDVFIKSEGSDAAACCFYAFTTITARSCRIHAAKNIFKGLYSNALQAEFYQSILSSLDHIANFTVYDGMYGSFQDCYIKAANGFLNGNVGQPFVFKNCTLESTIGYVFKMQPAYQNPAYLHLENTSIKAQTRCLEGAILNLQVIGGTMQSLLDIPFNFHLIGGGSAEFRENKLLAEAQQAFAIINSNGANKGVNLINVSMNKPFNANVDGLLHNVLIDDTLKVIV
jgi:hypothetical protein